MIHLIPVAAERRFAPRLSESGILRRLVHGFQAHVTLLTLRGML